MIIDRDRFFPRARASVFHGNMTQSQVNGVNSLLDAFELNGVKDARFIAYMLATTFHETAQTMEPIEEYSKGKGKPYGVVQPNGKVYYGRGYVQLTWPNNYKIMSPLVGVDLFDDPDKALDPSVAAKVMICGMTEGMFTGKKLSDYFNEHLTDFLDARRIINGMDCAAEIANYGRNFLASIGYY